jgi:cytochrome c556
LKRFTLALLFFSTVGAAPAWAQFAKPESAVEYRQSAFTLIANHMGRIKLQLDNLKPNMDVVRSSAAIVDVLKGLPFEAFVPGSSDVGDTAAKPEIWTEREKFDKLAHAMQDAVGQLNAAAKAGDPIAVRAAFGNAGKSCKNCHDDYKKKR